MFLINLNIIIVYSFKQNFIKMNNNLNKVTDLLLIKFRGCSKRYMQSNASLLENCFELRNNNPRNLELMTIARKPMGYHLEMPGHEYWHKLV